MLIGLGIVGFDVSCLVIVDVFFKFVGSLW